MGAIFSHITVLGIEVQGDGGLLFALALTVFGCSAVVAYARRKDILNLVHRLSASS
jgi:putative oxidoreductase